jgi:hypothetical protein
MAESIKDKMAKAVETNKTAAQRQQTASAVSANKAAQQARTTRIAETATTVATNAAASAAAAAQSAAERKQAQLKAQADAAAVAKNKAELDRINALLESERNKNKQATVTGETPEERLDAIAYLQDLFDQYGLGALAPRITELKQEGFSDKVVQIKLKETPEYKQRFSANEVRRKAGLPVLDPAEYLATESAYRQIMRDSGLPEGFYDNQDDFSNFLGKDVSPSELKSRVDIAALNVTNTDPYFTKSLQDMYGLSSGDMIAYALDPQKSLPFITRQVQATQFGAEAARQGIKVAKPIAETYANLGVNQQQARQGFEQVAQILPEAQRLSQITAGAQPFGLEETTSAVFGGEQSTDYKKRLQRLSDIEQSRFAGQSGVSRGSLGRPTSGQL